MASSPSRSYVLTCTTAATTNGLWSNSHYFDLLRICLEQAVQQIHHIPTYGVWALTALYTGYMSRYGKTTDTVVGITQQAYILNFPWFLHVVVVVVVVPTAMVHGIGFAQLSSPAICLYNLASGLPCSILHSTIYTFSPNHLCPISKHVHAISDRQMSQTTDQTYIISYHIII